MKDEEIPVQKVLQFWNYFNSYKKDEHFSNVYGGHSSAESISFLEQLQLL
jgi:hypothetical protein